MMRQIVVTGLSNEQDFENGGSVFILILNREVRVPISEELAAVIIQKMYGDDPAQVVREHLEQSNKERDTSTEDDDGIDQI